MIRTYPLLIVIVAMPAFAAAQMPQTFDDARDFIIFRDRAFLVGKPILVSPPTASHPVWSPTGQYLAYDQTITETNLPAIQDAVQNQRPQLPSHSICLYSVVDGKSTELFRYDQAIDVRDEVDWIPNSNKALITVTTITQNAQHTDLDQTDKIYFLDASNGTAKEFSPWEGADPAVNFTVSPSPSQPYAFVQATFSHDGFTPEGKPKKTLSYQTVLVGPDGLRGFVHVPDDSVQMAPLWSQDGSQAYVLSRVKDGNRSKPNWYRLNLNDGSLKPIDKPANFSYGGYNPPSGLITVRSLDHVSINGKSSSTINALWLETTDPDSQNRLLLAGDATDGEVNKNLDCASFISQGSLFVRPINEVSKKRYEAAMVAFNHMQAMDQARQAGTGLLMYAADYDNALPGQRANLAALLGPYLQDASALNGFVYTFAGGSLQALINPSATQLGYVDSADGRAVVYSDGHVTWVPK